MYQCFFGLMIFLFLSLQSVGATDTRFPVTIMSTPAAPISVFDSNDEELLVIPAHDVSMMDVHAYLLSGDYIAQIYHAGYEPTRVSFVVNNEPIVLHIELVPDVSDRWHIFDEQELGTTTRLYGFIETDQGIGIRIAQQVPDSTPETYIYYPDARTYEPMDAPILFPQFSAELATELSAASYPDLYGINQNLSQCNRYGIYALKDTYELHLINLDNLETIPIHARFMNVESFSFSWMLREGIEWATDCQSVALYSEMILIHIGERLDTAQFTNIQDDLLMRDDLPTFDFIYLRSVNFDSDLILIQGFSLVEGGGIDRNYWVYDLYHQNSISLPDEISQVTHLRWYGEDLLVGVSPGQLFEIQFPEMNIRTVNLHPYLGDASFGYLQFSPDLRFIRGFREDHQDRYDYKRTPFLMSLEGIYSPGE